MLWHSNAKMTSHSMVKLKLPPRWQMLQPVLLCQVTFSREAHGARHAWWFILVPTSSLTFWMVQPSLPSSQALYGSVLTSTSTEPWILKYRCPKCLNVYAQNRLYWNDPSEWWYRQQWTIMYYEVPKPKALVLNLTVPQSRKDIKNDKTHFMTFLKVPSKQEN